MTVGGHPSRMRIRQSHQLQTLESMKSKLLGHITIHSTTINTKSVIPNGKRNLVQTFPRHASNRHSPGREDYLVQAAIREFVSDILQRDSGSRSSPSEVETVCINKCCKRGREVFSDARIGVYRIASRTQLQPTGGLASLPASTFTSSPRPTCRPVFLANMVPDLPLEVTDHIIDFLWRIVQLCSCMPRLASSQSLPPSPNVVDS